MIASVPDRYKPARQPETLSSQELKAFIPFKMSIGNKANSLKKTSVKKRSSRAATNSTLA
jgi:hypothetical protein